MDKRTTKIVLACLACTLIVLMLFLIALRFSQLSCELINVEPQHLRSSQLHAFVKDKPIRSEDKTLLMKFSAYLEYDKPKSDSDDSDDEKSSSSSSTNNSRNSSGQQPGWSSSSSGANQLPLGVVNGSQLQQQQRIGPSPSIPTNLIGGGGGGNSSANQLQQPDQQQQQQQQQGQHKKRFLPLELDSIETRHLNVPNKYKYILSFNCTKMHMVLVRTPERVHIESMRLELKVKNKHKSECDVLLPTGGAFAVGQQQQPPAAGAIGLPSAANTTPNQSAEDQSGDQAKDKKGKELVHYYCNKPLRYSCVHSGDKSNLLNRPAGVQTNWLHLAELHISAIEFETSLSLGSSSSGGEQKLKHVNKSEFKSKRSATFYKAPVGSRIRIACNASRWQDDSVSLVLWFKGSAGSSSSQQPIYTLDARQRPLSSGSARHLVADSFRGRAKFVVPQQQQQTASYKQLAAVNESQQQQQQQPLVPYLEVNELQAEDQAEYRCRVDYRSRPRENFLIVLFVLVPPSRVEIMDSNGRSLEQIYGPLSEGSDLTLLCLAKGGRPAPAIQWLERRNEQQQRLIDDTYLTLNDFVALRAASALDATSNVSSSAPSATTTTAGDKNQRQTINSWPSPTVSQGGARGATHQQSVNSLVAEWRAWPEYEYFYSQLSSAGNAGGQAASKFREANEINNGNRLEASSGKKGPMGAAGGERRQQQQQQQLLDLQADETITTSVNVLHLAELGRDHLADVAGGALVAARQRLECHASNLHYDLRALIKLFAPPSLVSGAGDNGAPEAITQPPLQFSLSPAELEAGGQLVGAIERSLAASVRSHAPAGIQDERREAPGGALPLRQIKLDSGGGGGNLLLQEEAAAARAGWPAGVIYEQLARLHQLSEQANGGQVATASEQPAARQQQQQLEQDDLARSKLISLDLYLRPLDVRILGGQRPLAAGQVHEFTCTSSGSRPPARLVWLKNGRSLAEATNDEDQLTKGAIGANWTAAQSWSADGKQQRSKLALRLERQDNRLQLSCRATNEKALALLAEQGNSTALDTTRLASWQLEDSIALVVQYAPSVRLSLGNKMLSERLREGTDIYFECQVEAQPAAREVTWLHNDKPINETSWWPPPEAVVGGSKLSSRLIVSNNSLVLQRVRPNQSGQYACMASNSEGIGVSNRIELRVLHAPICVGGQVAPPPADHKDQSPAAPTSGGGGGDEAAEQPQEETSPASDNNDNKRKQHRNQATPPTDNGAPDELTPLELPASRATMGAHLSFRCEWLAEPAERTEFTWLLNTSAGERRLLADTSGESRRERGKSFSSKLSLDLRSANDFGQLFCLAKNELGQQKRACVYNIKLDERARFEPSVACLTLNVTSESAWVGCELANAIGGGRQAHERTNQLGNLSGRYQFDVLVYRYAAAADDSEPPKGFAASSDNSNVRNLKLNRQTGGGGGSGSAMRRQQQQQRLLEANLSSALLDEPLFALANLRPMTNYALEIYPLDLLTNSRWSRQPAVVKLSTSLGAAANGESSSGGGERAVDASEQRQQPQPSIGRITDPRRSDLLAAALRLANGDTLAAASGRSLLRDARPAEHSWWDALVGSIFGEGDQAPRDELETGHQAKGNYARGSKLAAQLLPAATGRTKSQSQWLQLGAWNNLTLGASVCFGLLITIAGLLMLRQFATSGFQLRRRAARMRGKQAKACSADGGANSADSGSSSSRDGGKRHKGRPCSSSLPPSDSCCLEKEPSGSAEDDDDERKFKLSPDRASSETLGTRATRSTDSAAMEMLTMAAAQQRQPTSDLATTAVSQQQLRERSASALLSATLQQPNKLLALGYGNHYFQGPSIYSSPLGSATLNSLGVSNSMLTPDPMLLPSSSRTNGSSAFGTMRLVHRPEQQQHAYQRHATNHNDQLLLPAAAETMLRAPQNTMHGQQQQTVTRSRSSVCFDSGSLLLAASDLGAAVASQPRLTHSSGNGPAPQAALELPARQAEQAAATGACTAAELQAVHRRLISDANFCFASSGEQSPREGAVASTLTPEIGGPSLLALSQQSGSEQVESWQQQPPVGLGRANGGCRCIVASRQPAMTMTTTTATSNKVQHANEHFGTYSNNRSTAFVVQQQQQQRQQQGARSQQANLHSLMSSTATTTITSDESNCPHEDELANCAELARNADEPRRQVDFIELLPEAIINVEQGRNCAFNIAALGNKFVLGEAGQLDNCYDPTNYQNQQQQHLVSPLGIESPSMRDQIVSSSSPALSLSPPQQIIYRLFDDAPAGSDSLALYDESPSNTRKTYNEKGTQSKQLTSILRNSSAINSSSNTNSSGRKNRPCKNSNGGLPAQG